MAQRGVKLDTQLVRKQAGHILRACGYEGWGMSISLTDNVEVRNLNRLYRQKNKYTDILSFPNHYAISPGVISNGVDISETLEANEKNSNFFSPEDDKDLGDIFISIPYVNQQCAQNNWKIKHRLPVLITHGVCHLIGYDHETNEDYAIMQKQEDLILEKIDGVDKVLGGAI